MSTRDKQQSGFIMIAVAIIAVLAIGLIGYIVWQAHNQPSSKQIDNATSNNSTTTQPAKESTTAATASPTGTYLDIKELGIKILLNSTISDAVYSIVPTTDGSKGAAISAQSLVDRSSATCNPSNYTLGLIEATTTAPTYVGGQKALPVDNKSLFKFGSTYYWYRPPQNETCLSNTGSQADTDTVQSKLNAFEQAFTTVQPDN